MKSHHYLTIAGVWALILIGLLSLKTCQTKRDVEIADTRLAANTSEKIIVNPLKRTLTVITAHGETITVLPDHPSSIEIMKSGKVKINSPQQGFEAVPFIGIGYNRSLNDYLGADFYYWKRLDLGAAFSFDRDLSFRNVSLIGFISYTVWNNSRLSVGIDTRGGVHGAITVRL